jgi:signal transduction histidine kinase
MHTGRALVIEDIRADTDAARTYRTSVGPYMETSFSFERSLIAVPLIHKHRMIGALVLTSREIGFFNARHEVLATAIASQAAVAIENARLYERALEVAALEERQRLARELHDSVSQALYGIALGAKTARTLLDRNPDRVAEPLDYVLAQAAAGLAEMRALIFELRPEALETEGLVAALEKQVDFTRARHGLEVDADLCEEPEVPYQVKEAMYRIAQEAIHNTVKHARARKVELRLLRVDGSVVLEVGDDGRGFDPHGEFPGHLGLKTMRERATQQHGTLDLESAPGGGTRIRVQIPVEAAVTRAS